MALRIFGGETFRQDFELPGTRRLVSSIDRSIARLSGFIFLVFGRVMTGFTAAEVLGLGLGGSINGGRLFGCF